MGCIVGDLCAKNRGLLRIAADLCVKNAFLLHIGSSVGESLTAADESQPSADKSRPSAMLRDVRYPLFLYLCIHEFQLVYSKEDWQQGGCYGAAEQNGNCYFGGFRGG